MHSIGVFVKQVPDPSMVSVSESGTLQRDGVPSMLDPFGRMALMTALRFRQDAGEKVTAVTMGPDQAEEVLRRCLEFGADDAVLMTDRRFAGSDTIATSRALAALAKREGFDIVFCGMQATDGDTAQVPPELAALLGYGLYSYVSAIRDDRGIVATQCYERYEQDTVMELPAVVSVCRAPEGSPQLPSLEDRMRASAVPVRRVALDDIGLPDRMVGMKGSATRVVKVTAVPGRHADTVTVDGSDPDAGARAVLEEVGI